MGGKMGPYTGFCADSKEVNPNITNAKSGQRSRLKIDHLVWNDPVHY